MQRYDYYPTGEFRIRITARLRKRWSDTQRFRFEDRLGGKFINPAISMLEMMPVVEQMKNKGIVVFATNPCYYWYIMKPPG